MSKPEYTIVAAMTRNRVIGVGNNLALNNPDDMRWFKSLTEHHAVVMGRKTFESIGRPLPNRRNIVISRQKGYQPQGVEVFDSLDAALEAAAEPAEGIYTEEVFIIGGAQVYEQALNHQSVRRMRLTYTPVDTVGDDLVYFPDFSTDWHTVDVNPLNYMSFVLDYYRCVEVPVL